MRIAAGILMIICGFTVFASTESLVGMFGEVTSSVFVPISILAVGLTWGGGICTFRRKAFWWALSGAICSVLLGLAMLTFPVFGLIFPVMGILAVISLIRRKGQFKG